MECVELETARQILRCPTEADINRIFTICQDADIASLTTVPHPYRLESATQFVSSVIPAGWSTGSSLVWGIYLKDPRSYSAWFRFPTSRTAPQNSGTGSTRSFGRRES
ncbi:RimJ/RimL family protein N-acetyltransferase [Arthrobacter psychrochitiniphilus]|nr:RimJ/RimL family protein N-acetyltransferase [Arthrobacter psychrochitiniphilus]